MAFLNVGIQVMLATEPLFCLFTSCKGACVGAHSKVLALLVNFQVVGTSKGCKQLIDHYP